MRAPLIPAILELARTHPHTRIVLDHVFGLDLRPGLKIDAAFASLAGKPNIYFKFTTINLDILREEDVPASDALKAVVALYGADHVMWGSDIGTSDGAYHEMVGRIVATAIVAPAVFIAMAGRVRFGLGVPKQHQTAHEEFRFDSALVSRFRSS